MAPGSPQKQHRRRRRSRVQKRTRKPSGSNRVTKSRQQRPGGKHRAGANSNGILPESDDPLEENIFEREPLPEGYIFVAKGDVYITRHCRTKTKDSHQVVYAVYDRRGKRTLGIRVPADIHAEVVKLAGLTASTRASAVEARDAKFISQGEQLLRSEFPFMPQETLELIIGHSFLKGSGRVGRATTTTDKRKATLAVEAHIRHKHTQYEDMLAAGADRKTAREEVWPLVVAIEEAWAGSSDDQIECLTLRPV